LEGFLNICKNALFGNFLFMKRDCEFSPDEAFENVKPKNKILKITGIRVSGKKYFKQLLKVTIKFTA
jgi:hypothetical protein